MSFIDPTDPAQAELLEAIRCKYMPSIRAILNLLPDPIKDKIEDKIIPFTTTQSDQKIVSAFKLDNVAVYIDFCTVDKNHDFAEELTNIEKYFNADQMNFIKHKISNEFHELRRTFAVSFTNLFSSLLTEEEIIFGRMPSCDKKNITLYYDANYPDRLGIRLMVTF